MNEEELRFAEAEAADLIKGLRRRAQACETRLSKVPKDDSEANVRSHVRLRAKAATYRHCADLFEDSARRMKLYPSYEEQEKN